MDFQMCRVGNSWEKCDPELTYLSIRILSLIAIAVILCSSLCILSIEEAHAIGDIYAARSCPTEERLTILEEYSEARPFRGLVNSIAFAGDTQVADATVYPNGSKAVKAKILAGRTDSDILFEEGQSYFIYATEVTSTEPRYSYGGYRVYRVPSCSNTMPAEFAYYHGLLINMLKNNTGINFQMAATLDGNQYVFQGKTSPSIKVTGASIGLGSNVTVWYKHIGDNGILQVALPKSIIGGITGVKVQGNLGGLQDAMVEDISTNITHTTYTVMTPRSTSAVIFQATHVVPEFPASTVAYIGITIFILILAVWTRKYDLMRLR